MQLQDTMNSQLYHELCITPGSFIILMLEASSSMHYHVEANALTLPYKKKLLDRFGGNSISITCCQKLCHFAHRLTATLLGTFATQNFITSTFVKKYDPPLTDCKIFPSSNKY